MKKVTLVLMLCALGACVASPNTDLAAAGTSLSAGIIAADAYFLLPPCGPAVPSGKVCKTQSTVKVIQTAMDAAAAAYLVAVQLKTPQAIANAQVATTALTVVVPASH